jgi:hypothetical protein
MKESKLRPRLYAVRPEDQLCKPGRIYTKETENRGLNLDRNATVMLTSADEGVDGGPGKHVSRIPKPVLPQCQAGEP